MRLVVIDSIAAVFRHTFDDYLQRTRVLSCVALNLSRIANGHQLAVRGRGVSEDEYSVGILLLAFDSGLHYTVKPLIVNTPD